MKYHLILMWFWVMFLISFYSFGQNDTLLLSNYDVIVGEVKEMNRGVLTIETNYSDQDFKIEWEGIRKLNIFNYYLFTLDDGRIINGYLRTSADGLYELTDKNGIVTKVEPGNIVYINKVDRTFWSRLDASIDLGYSFTRAQGVNQFNGRTYIAYSADRWKASALYNSVRTIQDSVPTVSRDEAELGYRYFLPKDYFANAQVNFLSNTEQLLDLRTTGQLGIGKYLIHSNSAHLIFGIGGAYVDEQFSGSETDNRTSWETFFASEVDLFDIGDFRLKTTATLFPSITERGRLRVDYKLDTKYDLPLDFYIGLGFSLNFDNQPAQNATKTDYVIQTSIGWSL